MLLKYKSIDKIGQPVTGLAEFFDVHCLPSLGTIIFTVDSPLIPGIIFTNLSDMELKVITNQLFEHGKIDMSKFPHAKIIFEDIDDDYSEI